MRSEWLVLVLLAGCGGAGTSDSDAGSNDAGLTPVVDAGSPGDAGTLVGTFTLLHKVADASSSLFGKVYDGPTPAGIVWEAALIDGDCELQTPRVPFCSTSCGSAVCVENDVCQAYPTSTPLGTVQATGVLTVENVASFDMTPVVNGYQPVTVSLVAPPFADGSALTLSSSGSTQVAAFTLRTTGVAPFALTSGAPTLERDQPLALTWTPGLSSTAARIKVKLDISHHGGTRGQVLCDTDDDGSLTLSGPLVTRLLDLGVAGFPTIVLRRVKVGAVVIPAGRVDFVAGSELETSVTIPGLQSCSDDTECTSPATCQADLTCG